MSDRVKRERKPVNYNEKEAGSMVPAWAAEVNYNGGSPASDKNKSLKKRPAAEKENAKQTAKPSKASKPAKKEDKEVPKDSPEKDIKPQKRSKKEKEPAVAERGKNAGLKILPIGELVGSSLCNVSINLTFPDTKDPYKQPQIDIQPFSHTF